MAFLAKTNNAASTISTSGGINTSATTVAIQASDVSLFPSSGAFEVTMWPANNNPTAANSEIVLVTAGQGTSSWTITRAQESTTAKTFAQNDNIALLATVKFFTDIENNLNAPIYNETPSGTINGSNTSFTLANTPISGSLQLYRDGQLLVGGGADYTLSGTTITMVSAPVTGTVLVAYYGKVAGGSGVNAATLVGYPANATPTANNIPVLDANGYIPGSTIPAPQGFLLNGKIVPSVTSNNLTVAIKGLNGSDPSATNPVYVRIGDTIRTITAALSVTKNAGTNWCNAGSTELQTYEVDYFVYLGYNATDGVVIGFSRYPAATRYDVFSTTTTNDFYCAISTITNAAAGDYYELIGRFGATLSAGAGYTWSVPTFTALNLIQKPILYTRTLSYFPTETSYTMTIGTCSSQVGSYFINGNFLTVFAYMIQAKSGSATTYGVDMTIPIALNNQISNVPYGFASMDNMFGAVALYGETTPFNRLQIRSYANMSTDSVGRGAAIGATGIPII